MHSYTLHDLVSRQLLGDERFYDAREADARIEKLERALRSVTVVLVKMLDKHQELDRPGREALNEADKALTVRT